MQARQVAPAVKANAEEGVDLVMEQQPTPIWSLGSGSPHLSVNIRFLVAV